MNISTKPVATFTSREFNQDTARAKRAAAKGPVFITDRGEPAYVLMSIEEFRRLEEPGPQKKPKNLHEALVDRVYGDDIEPPERRIKPIREMTSMTEPLEWLTDLERFHGEWQGKTHGANICVIANHIDGPGGGPKLHRHPYAETFLIRGGRGLFTVGDWKIEARAGQILVVPANTPHKFENLGPGPLDTIDIHENGEFITDWLE